MPNLYALALSAKRDYTTHMFAGYCTAENSEHAEGMGLKLCREQHPSSEGWHNHSVAAFLIPNDVIREIAALPAHEENTNISLEQK